MEVKFHKRFEKRFKKMPANLRSKVIDTIEKFGESPFDRSLHNHQLTGKMADFRSISISNDIRIIFQEFEHYTIVIMLEVGSHNVVY